MIDFDEIRKEIAIEHNVLLDKADPVLVSVTLNDLVLRRYAEILTEQNIEHRKAVLEALKQGNIEAKQTAGRIITDASNYVSEQVNTAVTAAIEEGLTQIRKSQKVTEEAKPTLRSVMIFSVMFSSCLAAVAIVVMGFFFRG